MYDNEFKTKKKITLNPRVKLNHNMYIKDISSFTFIV